MNLCLMFGKFFAQRSKVVQTAFVNEQTVEGIAYTYPSALGIGDDSFAHLYVSVLVEITMYHTGSCFYDRHLGSVAYKLYELLSTTRNAEVYVAYGIQHLACCLMGGRQKGHYIGIDAKSFQHSVDKFHAGSVGGVCILSSFQHTCISAFEAERENIIGYVGACFVNHSDDPEWDGYPLQMQSVIECHVLENSSKR